MGVEGRRRTGSCVSARTRFMQEVDKMGLDEGIYAA